MDEPSSIQVRLRADGCVVVVSADTLKAHPGATWQVLGYSWRGRQRMSFVRAEIDGESWVGLVDGDALDRDDPGTIVALHRQSAAPASPLTGWILFC